MKFLLILFSFLSIQIAHADDFSTVYSSNWKMHTERKVGAGVNIGGALGSLGIALDLNFEDENGAFAGFGQGPGYKTFAMAWKHSFEGEYLTPYTTLGYSRWYSSFGNGDVSDSTVLNQVLSKNEKSSGKFGADFITGSFGAQYNELGGDFQGLSFYGDVSLMFEFNKGKLIPLGSVGSIYYF